MVTVAILFYIVYSAILFPLYNYFRRNAPRQPGNDTGAPPPPRPWPWSGWYGGGGGGGQGGGGGGGGGGGRGPGGPSRPDPPPPYTGSEKPSTSTAQGNSGSGAWQPGFWTGLAGGAAGAALANGLRNRNQEQQYRAAPFGQRGGGLGFGGRNTAPAPRSSTTWDRGEGSSGTTGMGSMRSSSGFGGTRNR